MNIAIISEYNPFHNGHFYQIQATKEKYKCDNNNSNNNNKKKN